MKVLQLASGRRNKSWVISCFCSGLWDRGFGAKGSFSLNRLIAQLLFFFPPQMTQSDLLQNICGNCFFLKIFIKPWTSFRDFWNFLILMTV